MATRDNLLLAELHGHAIRCAVERRDFAQAVDELREIAKGRNDLLAEAAGHIAGAWCARPAMSNPHELIAAGLLASVPAPIDFNRLAAAVAAGYERGSAGRGPIHGVRPASTLPPGLTRSATDSP